MCKDDNYGVSKNLALSNENCIALMAVPRDEWKYRDQTFFLYFWRSIYLSLVVTFWPAFLKAVYMDFNIIVTIRTFLLAALNEDI